MKLLLQRGSTVRTHENFLSYLVTFGPPRQGTRTGPQRCPPVVYGRSTAASARADQASSIAVSDEAFSGSGVTVARGALRLGQRRLVEIPLIRISRPRGAHPKCRMARGCMNATNVGAHLVGVDRVE